MEDMTNAVKVINTTPHAVKLIGEEGTAVREYAPSGMTIRLQSKTVEVGVLPDGARLTRTEYGAPVLVTPEGEKPLPAPEEGVWFIVSAMAKAALPGRQDLLVPAEQVRDDQGRVIGCRSFGV
jgi:hypothetical protein